MRIEAMTFGDLTIDLLEPFGIATGAQTRADNVWVRVRLADGSVGLGEAAPFPAVNGETCDIAKAALSKIDLVGRDVRRWRHIASDLQSAIPESASARCALETAILDALCRSLGLPLWAFFGGTSTALSTDMTLTTGDLAHASRSATAIAKRGFSVLKLKVGGAPLSVDIERIAAVHAAAPGCALLIDANAGMSSAEDALTLLARANALGAKVLAFEQPLAKDDLAGQRELVARSAVPIIADESAGSLEDIAHIARERTAHGVNLKIMKSGVVQALDMAQCARGLGLSLMIGGMVESEIAMSTSACLAAGLGGFFAVDLDTHLFLSGSPVKGGIQGQGPALELSGISAGHGCDLS